MRILLKVSLAIESPKLQFRGSVQMSENGVWLTDFVDPKYITNLP